MEVASTFFPTMQMSQVKLSGSLQVLIGLDSRDQQFGLWGALGDWPLESLA